MSPSTAIQTRIPPISTLAVPRQRLFRMLDAGLEKPLTLLSAPAGYGKTVLVAHWLRKTNTAAAWLTVDEEEPGLPQFLQQVIQALQCIRPGIGNEALEILRQAADPTIQPVLSGLLTEIEQAGQPVCLVLDDYFHIQSSQIHQAIRFLLERCPPNFHLIILTRVDPPLRLSRYRAGGQMAEIRAEDLSLTEGETQSFLQGFGAPRLSPQAVSLLQQRTEGWAAGIQLSALALQKQTNPEAFITAFSGNQRFIFDYLTGEVLAQLPEEHKEFLLKTSILRQLSAPLCETLAGITILEELYQQNIFLQLVDEALEWYRYHGLFRDVLQSRLKRTYPAQAINQLHHLASAWYQQAGWGQEALQHSLDAGDFDRAGELIESMPELLTWSSGYHDDLIRTLEKLPESLVQSRPRLQLLFARTLLLSGQDQQAAQRLDGLEKQLATASLPEVETRHYLGMILTHRATRLALSGETARARDLANQALDCLPPSDLLTMAQAVHTLGLAADAEGHIRQAAGYFQQASRQAVQANHRNLAVVAASQQAFAEISLGELRQAEATTRQALQWGVVGSQELPVAAYAHVALAEVLRQQNHLAAADEEIQRALHQANKAIPVVRWHAALIQAQIRFSHHDSNGTVAILQQSETHFRNILPVHFSEMTQALLCRVRLAQERPELARDWLHSQQTCLPNPAYYQPNQADFLLILCRSQLAAGEKEPARELLDAIYRSALEHEKKAQVMETRILAALGAENPPAAHAYLQEALTLAEPQGYLRLFLDEGQALFDLLQSYRRQLLTPTPFLEQLLGAFQQECVTPTQAHNLPCGTSEFEALTGRELDVLAQIAGGASNQEIANRLVVSIHTVKKHAANIFIKLGVMNRTEAVARARALGLLKQ
jgi:LuxR family transcriptional regulator, maltose regulon positive regulatory protein